MLRITRLIETPFEVTLKLEGKIVSDWVELLEKEIRTLIKEGRTVNLDCSGVKYVDERAVELLRMVADRKLKIVNATALIQDLMERRV